MCANQVPMWEQGSLLSADKSRDSTKGESLCQGSFCLASGIHDFILKSPHFSEESCASNQAQRQENTATTMQITHSVEAPVRGGCYCLAELCGFGGSLP